MSTESRGGPNSLSAGPGMDRGGAQPLAAATMNLRCFIGVEVDLSTESSRSGSAYRIY